MIVSGTHVSRGSSGTPPAAGAAGGAIVCADCGHCSFSPQSHMRVTKYIPTCGPGLILTEQTANWPFLSASASLVRWEFNAGNWIEYACDANQWSFEASGIDTSTLPCVQNTNPGMFFFFASPCQGFEWRKETSSGVFTTFLRAVLVNNVCTPSVPA